MPSVARSRVLISAAVIFAVAFSLYFDKRISYTLLYALLLFVLISAVSVLTSPFCLNIRQSASAGRAVAGESALLSVKIGNSGPFPLYGVRLGYSRGDELDYGLSRRALNSVGPLSSTESSCRIRFPYRGVYRIGVESIAYTDCLGIFRMSRSSRESELPVVTVFPRVDESFAMPLRKSPQYRESRAPDYFSEPNMEIRELRAFTPEDDYRHIHWKLSAKRPEPVVKEYDADACERVILVIDTSDAGIGGEEKAALEDRIVSAAASASVFCEKNGAVTELVCGETADMRRIAGAGADFNSVLSFLAGLRFESESSVLSGAASFSAVGREAADIAIFSSALSQADFSALCLFLKNGCSVTFFLFTSPGLYPDPGLGARLDGLRILGAGVCVDGRWENA